MCLTLGGAQALKPQDTRVIKGISLQAHVHCGTLDCGAYDVQPFVRTRSRFGTGCFGNVPPGTTPNPRPPPESYLVKDVGKPGFPALKPDEIAVFRRVQRYVRSPNLRIAWVDGEEPSSRFIVFDAVQGPCLVAASGYRVLNGACNERYQPGENPYYTTAGTYVDCYRQTPRPWMLPTPR